MTLDTWGQLLQDCPDCGGEPDDQNHGHTVVCLSCGLKLGAHEWPTVRNEVAVDKEQKPGVAGQSIPDFVWPRCLDCGICVSVYGCSLDYSPEEYLAECRCRSVTASSPILALRKASGKPPPSDEGCERHYKNT